MSDQKPKLVVRRALFMPMWRKWFPALDQLPQAQAHHAVNMAMRDAMRTAVYVLTVVAVLAGLFVSMYHGLHMPGMGILAAITVYGVQLVLARRLLARRLPELLAA